MDPPRLHELEALIMDVVWREREASVRSVMEALNARAGKQRAYTTYMTIMGRLHDKGMPGRRREGKTHFYRPLYSRQQYAELRTGAEVESLVDQYGEVALSHLARQIVRLDPKRRQALERLAHEE